MKKKKNLQNFQNICFISYRFEIYNESGVRAKDCAFVALNGSFGALEIVDGFLCGPEGGPQGFTPHGWPWATTLSLLTTIRLGNVPRQSPQATGCCWAYAWLLFCTRKPHGGRGDAKSADASVAKSRWVARRSTQYWRTQVKWHGNAELNVKHSAFVGC